METDALYHSDERRSTNAVDPHEGHNESLREMSGSELRLMQEITLHQMRETIAETQLLLLGRIWYRLEQERRRRNAEIAALERMYFSC